MSGRGRAQIVVRYIDLDDHGQPIGIGAEAASPPLSTVDERLVASLKHQHETLAKLWAQIGITP